MRITISHNKPKEEIVRAVDRSFDDLFNGIGALPLRLTQEQRNWHGSTLHFALTARMGPLSSPFKGYIEVTDREITIDADLGILERMIPIQKTGELLGNRLRGLLT